MNSSLISYYGEETGGFNMKRKSLVQGTLILALASMISKFLGFFFRIPLIYLIGEQGIGLYQLTYPLYTFLLGLAAGVPVAISKMISERMALNRRREAQSIFKTAVWVMAIFGGLSSFGLLIFADKIIASFNWGEDAYYTLIGISFAPLFTCLLSAYRGYFQGLQEMTVPGASQIIEQIARVCIGVGLAYLLLNRGIPMAAGGASFGAVAGAMIGLLWMFYWYNRNKIQYGITEQSSSTIRILLEILKIAVPISLGHAIGSVMALVDSMIVPGLLKLSGYSDYTATILYGQLTGKAHVLVNVPLTISIALAQNIVPAIASAHALRDMVRLNKNIQLAFKFAMILAFPCGAGLVALPSPILSLVFQGLSEGWELMQILAVASIFIIVAQTATSVMNGVGKTMLPVLAIVIGTGIKIIINIVLIPIPALNIKAAAISTLIAYILIAILDIIFVIRATKVYINIQEAVIMPAICTIVMTFAVLLIHGRMVLLTSSNISTLAAILGGGAVYFVMLLMTGTLSIKELRGYVKR
jgi:stage V sporulation protein B